MDGRQPPGVERRETLRPRLVGGEAAGEDVDQDVEVVAGGGAEPDVDDLGVPGRADEVPAGAALSNPAMTHGGSSMVRRVFSSTRRSTGAVPKPSCSSCSATTQVLRRPRSAFAGQQAGAYVGADDDVEVVHGELDCGLVGVRAHAEGPANRLPEVTEPGDGEPPRQVPARGPIRAYGAPVRAGVPQRDADVAVAGPRAAADLLEHLRDAEDGGQRAPAGSPSTMALRPSWAADYSSAGTMVAFPGDIDTGPRFVRTVTSKPSVVFQNFNEVAARILDE